LVDEDLIAVRVDLCGLGDSPARPGRRGGDAYTAAAAEDYSDVVAYLAGLGVDAVTIVGLCSGALLAYDGALATERITDVVSINPRFDKPFRDRRRDRATRAAGQSLWVFQFLLSKSPLNAIVDAVPDVVWTVLARLHLVALPSVALERVLDRRSTRVLLLFSQEERGLAALRRRSASQFAAIEGDPRVDVVELDSYDHSMFDLALRAQVLELVRRRLKPGGR
jgi:pimeloyl-ACP methyl ester carboxylesterase